MARNSVPKRKKPMGTAVASNREKKLAASSAAEEALVNDLMRMSRKFLAKVPASEREARLRKLNAYLSSLEGSVAKRA